MNTCQFATPDCKEVCIYKQGRGQMPSVVSARIDKTLFLFHHREDFLASLRWDIQGLERQAKKLRFCPECQEIKKVRKRTIRKCRKCGAELRPVPIAVRINGTSDLAWIGMQMADEHPHVQFYDYTKLPRPYLRMRPNYAITFSHTGYNLEDCLDALAHGVNVAVAFAIKKATPLPETWHGYPVVDGDTHDLRFLDPRGVIVGLRGKGVSWKRPTAFMVQVWPQTDRWFSLYRARSAAPKQELIQISLAA